RRRHTSSKRDWSSDVCSSDLKVLVDLASKRIPYPHSGLITSQRMLREKHDAMLRFGRATVEAIHFFKTQKAPTIAVLKKYAKTRSEERRVGKESRSQTTQTK